MVRAVAKRVLSQRGFAVLVASDGIEGLQLFRENMDGIVAVVLDLTMPRMGGEEVYQELRSLRKDLHIILSSGHNEEDVLEQFSSHGPTAFIQKPYLPAVLSEKIREVLGPQFIETPAPGGQNGTKGEDRGVTNGGAAEPQA